MLTSNCLSVLFQGDSLANKGPGTGTLRGSVASVRLPVSCWRVQRLYRSECFCSFRWNVLASSTCCFLWDVNRKHLELWICAFFLRRTRIESPKHVLLLCVWCMVCVWVCVYVYTHKCMFHTAYVEARGQLCRVAFLFLFLHGVQGQNSGCWAFMRHWPSQLCPQRDILVKLHISYKIVLDALRVLWCSL